MAVVEPDSLAVVFAVAFHGVVGEVALGHFLIRVDHNLSRRRTGNDPVKNRTDHHRMDYLHVYIFSKSEV